MRNNLQATVAVEANRSLINAVDLSGSKPLQAGSSRSSRLAGGLAALPLDSRHRPERKRAVAEPVRQPWEPPSVLTLYMREIGRVELLPRQAERELALRVQRGDAAAREQMIKANLRLVVKIARDFEHSGLPLLDLISEGNIGLMKAVERYDPEKGAKLSVYASFWIKQQIRRAIQDFSRTIRLPAYCQEKLHAINAAALRLRELLGREPTDEEVARQARLPEAKVRQVREAAQAPVSLEESQRDMEDRGLADTVPDENAACPYETLARSAALDQLRNLLGALSPKERGVLQARFGLNGESERSLQEIGQQVGLTRERVRQIQNAALAKLRELIQQQEVECVQE